MTTTTVGTDRRDGAPRATGERPIAGIYGAPPLHWVGDGFHVAGYFSRIPDAVRRLSPFLLLDYHPAHDYRPSTRPRGVGVHPHRGFETVTLAFQGSVAHHDSAGGGGVIGPGDAQWMTAASGVLHKEYHEEAYARRGGPFQMAQLWVNLPRAHKMDPPRYQAIRAEQMGVAELDGGAGTVRVLAGRFRDVAGPAATFTPVDVFHVRLQPGGVLEVDVPRGHNAGLLVMKGGVTIQGAEARVHDFVLFGAEGDRIRLVAREEAELLYLAGEPIDEPVVQYGPFVMNTPQEIAQAVDDLRRGKFGTLDD